MSSVPPASEHWNNQVLSIFPEICTTIEVAVGEFQPFLSPKSGFNLEAEYIAFKQHCKEKIPKALSAAELMYGGGTVTAKESKQQFHKHIENLLCFATET